MNDLVQDIWMGLCYNGYKVVNAFADAVHGKRGVTYDEREDT